MISICHTQGPVRVIDTFPYRPVRPVSAQIWYPWPPFLSRPTFRLISDNSARTRRISIEMLFSGISSSILQIATIAITCARLYQIATQREGGKELYLFCLDWERERRACRLSSCGRSKVRVETLATVVICRERNRRRWREIERGGTKVHWIFPISFEPYTTI